MSNYRQKTRGWAIFINMIIFILLCAGCNSSDDSEFKTTIQETTTYIQNEMDKHGAVGLSIALVSEDKLSWARGFGWADKEKQITATADTVYMLGSGTKVLTTVALMMLQEQGIVSLDSPAANYLTEFSMANRYSDQLANMTVRRLLNHHSGIPGDIYNGGFLSGEPWNQWGCNLYMDWLMDYLKSDYPSHPPGQMATYCNTGFVLAGEIALRQGGISGEAFQSYIDRVLFSPIGMTNTSLNTITRNLAVGYQNGKPTTSKQTNCTFGATGGAYTTVLDMARFLIMLNNGGTAQNGARILNPETVALLGEAEASTLDIDSFFQPGLGWDTMDDAAMRYAGRAWMKSGGVGDYFSLMEVLPDKKLGVIVLANADKASLLIWGVVRHCLQQAVLEKYGISPAAPDLPEYTTVTEPSEIAGLYVKKYGYDRVADNGDGTLTWTVDAQGQDPNQYLLRLIGNAYVPEGRTETVSFQNLQRDGTDHFVMIQSGSSGSDPDEYIYFGYVRQIVGEKRSAPSVSDPWKNRTGVYAIDNLPWNDAFWDSPPFATLVEKDGILLWNGINVAFPEDDATAFIGGISSRSDSSIRVIEHEGVEKMLCEGYRVNALDNIPAVVPGEVITGTVALFKSDWFRFDAALSGQTVKISVTTDRENYVLSVFYNTTTPVVRETGSVSWQTQEGTYYLAITPTPDADGNYTVMVE